MARRHHTGEGCDALPRKNSFWHKSTDTGATESRSKSVHSPASTHTASVSSPSLTVLHLPTYIGNLVVLTERSCVDSCQTLACVRKYP